MVLQNFMFEEEGCAMSRHELKEKTSALSL